MTALQIFVADWWPLLLLFCIAVAGLAVWARREWHAIDAPHTYDDRLAQREIDIARAHAEEEAYAIRQRRRVRAGRTL